MVNRLLEVVIPSDRVVLVTSLSRSEIIARVREHADMEGLAGSARKDTIQLRLAGWQQWFMPRIAFHGAIVQTANGIRIDGKIAPSGTQFMIAWFVLLIAMLFVSLLIWLLRAVLERPGILTSLSELLILIAAFLALGGIAALDSRLTFSARKHHRSKLLAAVQDFLSARVAT